MILKVISLPEKRAFYECFLFIKVLIAFFSVNSTFLRSINLYHSKKIIDVLVFYFHLEKRSTYFLRILLY